MIDLSLIEQPETMGFSLSSRNSKRLEKYQKIKDLKDAGKSIEEIQSIVGLSRSVVYYHLQQHENFSSQIEEESKEIHLNNVVINIIGEVLALRQEVTELTKMVKGEMKNE